MIHVVRNEADNRTLWEEGRDNYKDYLFPILTHLGWTYRVWSPEEWSDALPPGLTLVIGSAGNPRWDALCTAYCEAGNALLAIGGTYGLTETLGVSASGTIKEGWAGWEGEPSSPARQLRGSFHFFEAVIAEAVRGDVQTYGCLIPRGEETGSKPAATFRRPGRGCAALLAVDLMHTFCRIQQGVPVLRDGHPAPDGTAAIDDGIFKTDDACVLDWIQDRDAVEEDGAPFFLHPVVDEWRIVFARMMHRLLQETNALYAQRWYWPAGLPAIGHISHDTDGNSPEHARRLLERLKEADVRSTWCIIMPGYDAGLNAAIAADGHEPALHYNALGTEIAESDWSEAHFRHQLDMLQRQFPEHEIVSNKNHYLRWEGDVQFYRWCERAGIRMEMSFGGTKQGNKGFTAGTCHPYRPVGVAAERNRLLDTVSLPVLTWDPPVKLRCTGREAEALLDRAIDVNGVAHYLFHPQKLIGDGDEVGAMLVELANLGRARGIEWWTSERIRQWLQDRDQAEAELERDGDGWRAVVTSGVAVAGLTLLLPERLAACRSVEAENGARIGALRPIERFGCPFAELQLDVPAGRTALVFR